MHGRGTTLFLNLTAIACLVAAALTMNWWAKSAGFGDARLGLRDAEVCVLDSCEKVDLSESPLARAHRPSLLYGTFVGLLAIAGLLLLQAIGGFVRAEPFLAGWMAIVCFLGVGLALVTGFVGGILNVSWSFLLALSGNVLATIVLVQSLGARRAAREARQRALVRASRAAQPPSLKSPAAAVLSDRLAPSSAPGGHVVAGAPSVKKKPATGEHALLPRTDAAGSMLRFSVRDAVIGETSLRALLADAEQRTIDLAQVAELYVRMMPQDGPAARTVFLDIVPAPGGIVTIDESDGRGADDDGLGGDGEAGRGAERLTPLRFLPTTRANYGVLPGGAAVASQENFRRLAARILELSPSAKLDEDTRAFVKENRAPRQLLALSHFAEYDARYA